MAVRYEGSIKSWREPWGWISSPEAGQDVFCHVQDVVSGHIGKDAHVSFELGTDEKSGKPRARNIEVHGVTQRLETETGPRITGTIKSWKEAWGWINSDQLQEAIFGHREDLVNVQPGHSLQPDMEVRFDVGTDDKSGKPRAKRIELVDQPEQFIGKVASWKDAWGWISCEKLAADGDVFAHSDDLLTIVQVGERVTFELGSDIKTGKRRARNISAIGGKACGKKGGMPMAQPVPMMGKGQAHMAMSPMMASGGKGWDSKGYGKAAPSASMGGKGGGGVGPQAYIGQRLEGQVTTWKDKMGWISCHLFEGDLFAHVEDLQGPIPAVGSSVSFTPGTNREGKMRALMIAPSGGGYASAGGAYPGYGKGAALAGGCGYAGYGAGAAFAGGAGKGVVRKRPAENAPRPGEDDFQQLEGLVVEGEVSMWREAWGWISSFSFKGDLFAHKEDILSGEDLYPGQHVFFMVSRDHKSARWRATQINDATTAGGPVAKRPRVQ